MPGLIAFAWMAALTNRSTARGFTDRKAVGFDTNEDAEAPSVTVRGGKGTRGPGTGQGNQAVSRDPGAAPSPLGWGTDHQNS